MRAPPVRFSDRRPQPPTASGKPESLGPVGGRQLPPASATRLTLRCSPPACAKRFLRGPDVRAGVAGPWGGLRNRRGAFRRSEKGGQAFVHIGSTKAHVGPIHRPGARNQDGPCAAGQEAPRGQRGAPRTAARAAVAEVVRVGPCGVDGVEEVSTAAAAHGDRLAVHRHGGARGQANRRHARRRHHPLRHGSVPSSVLPTCPGYPRTGPAEASP